MIKGRNFTFIWESCKKGNYDLEEEAIETSNYMMVMIMMMIMMIMIMMTMMMVMMMMELLQKKLTNTNFNQKNKR